MPVLLGLTAATVGAAAWTAVLPSREYLWQVPGMLLAGIGMGLPVPALSAELMRAVPADKRADASVLRQSIRQLGGAVGLAAGAVVLAANERVAEEAGVISVTATSAAFLVASWVLAATLPLASPCRAGPVRAGAGTRAGGPGGRGAVTVAGHRIGPTRLHDRGFSAARPRCPGVEPFSRRPLEIRTSVCSGRGTGLPERFTRGSAGPRRSRGGNVTAFERPGSGPPMDGRADR